MTSKPPPPAEGARSARHTGSPRAAARYTLVRVHRSTPYGLSLAGVADHSGLAPDLVRRFAALGLVDAERDSAGQLWFRAGAPAALARVQRLRTGLCLNYAAVGVVLDLLDRIDQLEAELQRSRHAAEERTSWT